MTPARRHRERALAALQGAANPQFDQVRANAYELQLMQLAEHRRTLKGIQSIERKIDAKRTMLPVYKPWIDGLLAADRAALALRQVRHRDRPVGHVHRGFGDAVLLLDFDQLIAIERPAFVAVCTLERAATVFNLVNCTQTAITQCHTITILLCAAAQGAAVTLLFVSHWVAPDLKVGKNCLLQ